MDSEGSWDSLERQRYIDLEKQIGKAAEIEKFMWQLGVKRDHLSTVANGFIHLFRIFL